MIGLDDALDQLYHVSATRRRRVLGGPGTCTSSLATSTGAPTARRLSVGQGIAVTSPVANPEQS
jgi:hypothetical protein